VRNALKGAFSLSGVISPRRSRVSKAHKQIAPAQDVAVSLSDVDSRVAGSEEGCRMRSSLDRFELESLPPWHAHYGSNTRPCNAQRDGGQAPKCAPDRASPTRRCRPYTTWQPAADTPRRLTRRVKGTCSRAYGAPYSMSDMSSHQA
jgi:hypothetical protein